jgi:hypothetical protein
VVSHGGLLQILSNKHSDGMTGFSELWVGLNENIAVDCCTVLDGVYDG